MSFTRAASSSSLAITDPLVKYQALLATGVYGPDPAQHRLAHHLQKIYFRLKDYNPGPEYRTRLSQVTQAVKATRQNVSDELAVEGHPIRRNPLFARFFQKAEGQDSLALTRVLTSHQAALHADSPKGMFLSGEVGTGKSMLLDLLAEGLPTSRKRRWHFNTFMLYAFSRLEQFRTRVSTSTGDEHVYSLLWLAKEIVEESPILFLDEFQLPDRAASKILNNFFVAFFQLGGVLVASSNRMPEELEKATGGEYVPSKNGGLVKQVLGLGRQRQGELFGDSSDFATFLEVLKARCDFWQMEGVRDWRRREDLSAIDAPFPSAKVLTSAASTVETPGLAFGTLTEGNTMTGEPDSRAGTKRPTMYFSPAEGDEMWRKAVSRCFNGIQVDSVPWQSAELVVYGRSLKISKQQEQVTYWDFAEIVQSFGPADYISLASNYNVFIIDRVPVLDVAMKNEARRFITLLDALYEARCKLIIRADASPDDLFFPETTRLHSAAASSKDIPPMDDSDATYSETIADVYQNQMSPFRPNVSAYSESPNSRYNPDQDSDFGAEEHKAINFSQGKAFTGEDERFAYKRATSRLWELCSAQWHERTGDWWQPLPIKARHWEGREPSKPHPKMIFEPSESEITLGPSVQLDEPVGLERFRLAALKEKG